MENYIKFFNSKFEKSLSQSEVYSIEMYLKNEPGILEIVCTRFDIRIEYNSFSLSDTMILESLSMLGFETVHPLQKQSSISRWLSKLAKSNKESFGSQRLDCCDMNNN